MNALRRGAVVLDLDNTLYDWVSFYVPSLKAMIAAMRDYLKVSDDEIVDQLREAYAAHSSLEYAFVAQSLPLSENLDVDEVRGLVEAARNAFAHARKQNLNLYPGVLEGLSELADSKLYIVAATNAPLYQAQRRLRHLGVLEFFDGIAARASFEVPEEDLSIPAIIRKARVGYYDSPVRWQWAFAAEDLKPSSCMYETVFEALKINPRDAIVVGDSLAKDIVPALDLGARGAWARYGTEPDPDDLAFLLRVTPWSAGAVRQQYSTEAISDLPILDQFDELIALIT